MTGADVCRVDISYNYLIISTLIIFSLFGLSDADSSSLQLVNSTCGNKIQIYNGVRISPSKAISTVYSRTSIECLSQCVDSFPACVSVYRNDQGQCMQFSSINISNFEDDSTPNSGVYMKIGAALENDDCAGDGCSEDEVCLEGCGDNLLPSPACVKKVRETCDSRPEFDNIRHYWASYRDDDRDSGTVLYLTYPKLSDMSGLRVIAYMTVRTYGNNACAKWYYTFDNNPCDDPQPIEMQNYLLRNVNYLSTMDLDGTCYGLSAGNVRIDVKIGTCEGMGVANTHTGHVAPKSVLVMEVTNRTDNQKICTSAVSFNFKYESWVDDLDITQNFTESSYLIKSVEYRKISDESKLRVKYSAYTGLYLLSDDTYCARWYVAINGTECDPALDVIILIADSHRLAHWENKVRTRALEGICNSTLPAGVYSIDIYLGACNSTEDIVQPTRVIVGDQTPSRLSVEEVRPETSVDTIYGDLSGLYKSHVGNLQHWSWTSLNSDVDTGEVLSVTYNKRYTDTALRLTANGAHLSTQSGSGICAKWYFTIDSNECTDPGAIEGIHYYHSTSSGTLPLQVSGVCNGITTGTHRIGYSIKICHGGWHQSDARTGWDSSFTVVAEELRTELSHTCTGTPANCGP